MKSSDKDNASVLAGMYANQFDIELENAGRALRDARRTYLALLEKAKKRQELAGK